MVEHPHASATRRNILSAVAGASVFAAVVWLSAADPQGQRLPVRVITTADGLPRDQIACVKTDARGFVWFCTEEGLVRWDGHTAVTFGVTDGLSVPRVRSLLRTRAGRFWVGTDTGLFEFAATPSGGRTRFREVLRSDGQQTATVYAIAESGDRSLWVGTGQGLFRLNGGDGDPRLGEVDVGLRRDTANDVIVRALVEDNEGTLWIGTGSGVYARRVDGQTVRISLREGLPDEQVWAVAIGDATTIWAGTRSGLARIDRRGVFAHALPMVQRVYGKRDGLPSDNVRAIHAGSSLWIGAVGGVAEATLDDRGGLVIGRTVGGFYAWDVLEDAHGDVWIATESGARKLTRRGFTTYAQSEGLAGQYVASVFVTPAGEVCVTILAGTISVSCFDGHQFRRAPSAALDRIRDTGWGWSQLTWQDRAGVIEPIRGDQVPARGLATAALAGESRIGSGTH